MFDFRNSMGHLDPIGDEVNLQEIQDLDSLISAIRSFAKQEEYANTVRQSIVDIDNFIDFLKQEPTVPENVREAILYFDKSTAAPLFEKIGRRGDSLTYRDIQEVFSGAITKQVTNALTGSSLNPSELFVITGHLERLSSLIKASFSMLESTNLSFTPRDLLESILSQLEEKDEDEKNEALKIIKPDQMRISRKFRLFFSEGLHLIITSCLPPGTENCELITGTFNDDNHLFDSILSASNAEKGSNGKDRMSKIKNILTEYTEFKEMTIHEVFELLDSNTTNLSNEDRHLYEGLKGFLDTSQGLTRSKKIKFGFLLALFNVKGMRTDLSSYIPQNNGVDYTRNSDGTVYIGNRPVET